MMWSPNHDRALAGIDDAGDQFDRWARIGTAWGPHAGMIFGPLSEGLDSPDEWDSKALWIDADFGAGRAAVRWIPDGSYGVELDTPDGPIIAGFNEPEEIPAELARVSVAKAREAVIEYVTTGEKPTCVRWDTVQPSH
ncbi:Imm1 family immunity protein [Longispora urticae]